MFRKIIYRTFWSWWDNFSYSIITSFFGSTNPFFLIFLATFQWILGLLTQSVTSLDVYKDLIFVLCITTLVNIHTFPTTVVAYALQDKLIDGPIDQFFRTYWTELKRIFGRTMIVTLINIVIGGLLAFSFLFYNSAFPADNPLKFILIGISAWFLLILLISQIYMVPLMVREKYRFWEYYMISIYMTFKHAFLILGVSLVNAIIFLLFAIPIVSPFLVVVPIVAYFGLVSTLHIWTFRYVDGEISMKDPMRRRKLRELFAPFINLLTGKRNDSAEPKVFKNPKPKP